MENGAHELVRMTAIAIGIGILAQVIARKVRLPSIVFLLVFGVAVGPDVLGWIDTGAFGAGLEAIVQIAVALILFEGGLQLHYVDLAAVGRAVRNLVTIGTAVTVAGATLAAHAIAGFPWPLALLFGAIVSVTGPTVINPLLDRVHVRRRLDTVLRGEGIVIDPKVANRRAIEFYRRLGFEDVGVRDFDEDVCLVMRLERARADPFPDCP